MLHSGMKSLLIAQESVGRRVGENPFIGKWRIVVVRELPFTDQRLNGKIPKVGRAKIGSIFAEYFV